MRHGIAAVGMIGALVIGAPEASAQRAPAPSWTLEQAIARAGEQDNVRLEVFRARIERARARVDEARAALLPTLRVSATGTRNGQEIRIGDRVFLPRYDWGANGAASVVLFDASLYPGLRQSQRLAEQVQADVTWRRRVLAFEIEQAALVLMAAQREVEIVTETIELRGQDVARLRALVEAASAVPLDVARAEQLVLEARQRLLDAQRARGDAAAAVRILAGKSPEGGLRLEGSLAAWAESAALEPGEELGEALGRRQDFVAQAYQIEANRLAEDSVWGQLWPQLTLSANGRLGPSTVGNPDGFLWSVSLNLAWVLYDGGARTARAAQVEQQTRELRAQRRVQLLEASDEVLRVRREFEAARGSVEVATQQVELARRALQMAQRRFEAGVASSVELRDASQARLDAELALNQAHLRLATARARHELLMEL